MVRHQVTVQVLFACIVFAFGLGIGIGSLDWTVAYPNNPMAAAGVWAWLIMTLGASYAIGVVIGEEAAVDWYKEEGWTPPENS